MPNPVSGKQAKIRYTANVGTSSTDNAATITTGAGTGNSSIQINSTARRIWDRSSTAIPELYLNSTLVPSTAIDRINYVQGIFELNESRTSTGTYTIDCHFLTASYLTGARSWNMDVNVDMLDNTTLSTSTADVQWRTYQAGLSDATMNFERLISTGDTGPVIYDRIVLESDIVFQVITNDWRSYEGYAYIDGDSINTDPASLTVESFSARVDGQLEYSTA